MKNIIETAVANPDFSTLVTAIKKADLVSTLSGKGPFTVFAPNNKAFEKIAKKTLNEVLADQKKLKSILTYHVVTGKVMAKDVEKMSEATTLEGSKVDISSESEVTVTEVDTPDVSAMEMSAYSGIMINDANIIKADIECSNGVIHVIDTVLMP
jgi:uncharacterized surface protein with fasciclin (FAS1) repeats